MPRRITEACISCAACASECPTNAIDEGEDRYVVNPEACTDCADIGEHQCVEACPIAEDAITAA